MLKRILSLILLMTTGLALCACPGGAPVEPPTGNCPTCGKDPCECPTGKPCPDCGNDPCTCNPSNPEQPSTGKEVTLTPDKADFSIVLICKGIRNHITAPTIAKMVPEIISELYFIFIWFTSIFRSGRPMPVRHGAPKCY